MNAGIGKQNSNTLNLGALMISDVKVWPLKRNNAKVKANASFTIDNKFRIRCTIFQGQKGLYVGLPGKYGDKIDEETGKKVWYEDVTCINREARQELTQKVIDKFNEETGNVMSQGSAPGPENQDNIPW